MRIDKEKLAALNSLDDEALWQEIVKMARRLNLKLPEGTPRREEMNKIRTLLGEGKISPLQAMKIMSSYKKENDRGR